MRRLVTLAAITLISGVLFLAKGGTSPVNSTIHEESDRFWQTLEVRGTAAEHYGSLETMALSADAVVVATIARVEAGRVFGEPLAGVEHPEEAQVFFATAFLEVHRVLLGEAPDEVQLELLLPERGDLAALLESVPKERAIYFLRNKGVDAATQNRPIAIQERDEPYWRRVTPYGMLREIDGTIHVGGGEPPEFFKALEGQSLEKAQSTITSFKP